jgi:hypothetical protein
MPDTHRRGRAVDDPEVTREPPRDIGAEAELAPPSHSVDGAKGSAEPPPPVWRDAEDHLHVLI